MLSSSPMDLSKSILKSCFLVKFVFEFNMIFLYFQQQLFNINPYQHNPNQYNSNQHNSNQIHQQVNKGVSIPNPYQLSVNQPQQSFGVVSSSLNFGDRTETSTPRNINNYNNNKNNVIYGQQSAPSQYYQYYNNNAESRSDPTLEYDLIPQQVSSPLSATQVSLKNNEDENNGKNRPFPSFILNPRAASSVYTNRVARKVPKTGIQTRFINDVPIRQWQWPDYVDDN